MSEMDRACTMLLLILVCAFVYFLQNASAENKLLLILTENSNVTLPDLWNTPGTYNDPSNTRQTMALREMLKLGDYRSSDIDEWNTVTPEKVFVMATNAFMESLFHIMFDTDGTFMELNKWLSTTNYVTSYPWSLQQLENSMEVTDRGFSMHLLDNTSQIWFQVNTENVGIAKNTSIILSRDRLAHPVIKETTRNYGSGEMDSVSWNETGIVLTEIVKINSSDLQDTIYVNGISISTNSSLPVIFMILYRIPYCTHNLTIANFTIYREDGTDGIYNADGNINTLQLIHFGCLWIFMSYDQAHSSDPVNIWITFYFPVERLILAPYLVIYGVYQITEAEKITPTNSETILSTTIQESVTTFEASLSQSLEDTTSSELSTTQTTDTVHTTETVFTQNTGTILSNITGGQCQCYSMALEWQKMTENEKDEYINEQIKKIERELVVNKTKLSSYIRKKISIYDKRTSSISMGSFAVAVISSLFVIILCSDVTNLIKLVLTF